MHQSPEGADFAKPDVSKAPCISLHYRVYMLLCEGIFQSKRNHLSSASVALSSETGLEHERATQ